MAGGHGRGRSLRRAATALFASLLVFGSLITAGGSAQPVAQPGFRVYVIVLDGLEPQEVTATFMPNLSELKGEGTWYEQARAVFPAETLPNHAAMMTGVLPNRNGIIGNQFAVMGWPPGTNRPGSIYKDGCCPGGYMDNPAFLEADTLTTRLENCCAISTATVLSKAYLYNLFHGEPWLDTPPAWVDTNPQRQADYHFDVQHTPGYIPDPDGHAPDQVTMNVGLRPWVDSNPPSPQFAFVNLGDIDRSGHVDAFGSDSGTGISAFRQAAIADTDALIGKFVDDLKESGAWDESVLIFTSDHGMDWSPGGYQFASAPKGVDVSATLQRAGYTYLNGPPSPRTFFTVASGGTAQVYPSAQGQELDVAGMAKAISAHPGVAFVATPESIPELGNPTLHEMGLDHPNNGQIVVFVKPGWAVRDSGNQGGTQNPLPGNHGHPETQPSVLLVTGGHDVLDDEPESVGGEKVYDPDTKLFSPPAGGPGNLSIAPTVAALFGIGEPPGGYDGDPLREAFEPYALAPHQPGEAGTPKPDVALTKSDRPDPARVGQTLTYTLEVRNTGFADATGVRVVDDLPATVKPGVTSASRGSIALSAQRVTWDIGQLASGEFATATITVRPTRKGTLSNHAAVTLIESDMDASNNEDTEPTVVR